MSASSVPSTSRIVHDRFGRSYRVGETPEQLTGYGRWVFIIMPWIAMMLISSFEYAWGTAEDTVGKVYGWNLTHLAFLFSLWVVFEAGSSAPTGWLRERGYLSAQRAVLIGGIAVAVAYWSMTVATSPWVAFIGWTVIGGIGAGMIYSSSMNISSKWYPENKGLRTGFLNGGFAYGAVPFIFIVGAWFHPNNFRPFLWIAGLVFGLGLIVCSRFFKDPPPNWWPAHVDPIEYREEAERRRELNVHKNPPSVRQWTIGQAFKTRQIYLLWLNMFIILAAGLFGIAWTVPVAKNAGWAALAAASAGAIFALIDGIGRPIAGWLSEYLGRQQSMRFVFGVMAVGLLGNYWGAVTHQFAIYLGASAIVGLCVGMQFPLFATITADYYGESTNAQNYGVVYSAKVPGGLAGGVLGSVVIAHWGYNAGFLISAGLALLAVLLTFTHHQPTLEQYRKITGQEGEELPFEPRVAGQA